MRNTKLRRQRIRRKLLRRVKVFITPVLGLSVLIHLLGNVSLAAGETEIGGVHQTNFATTVEAESLKCDVPSAETASAIVCNAITTSEAAVTIDSNETVETMESTEPTVTSKPAVTAKAKKQKHKKKVKKDVFKETRSIEKYVPDYCGSVHPFMGWQTITAKGTDQYKLRMEAQNFDSDGIGKIKDRYAVAVKPYYGKIGDFLNVTQNDGTTYKCIIVDFKGMENEEEDGWLATYAHGDNDIIEFVVDKTTWYDTEKSISTVHPEWIHNIREITNVGNYWDQ